MAWRIFRVSSMADRLVTRPIPSRSRSARAPASLPASDAVCDTVAELRLMRGSDLQRHDGLAKGPGPGGKRF